MHRAQLVSAVSGHYLHVGVIQISVTNLVIIVSMVAVFVAAVLVPFPRPKGDPEGRDGS